MAHVNNKFERKFRGPRIALQNACQKESERSSTRPFLLWHFSRGDKIENCPAQFLAVCWIVRVEFKVHPSATVLA
jgi:hypothetical protein